MKLLQKMLFIMIITFVGNTDVNGLASANGIITALPPPPIIPFAPLAPGTPRLDFNSIATIAAIGPHPIAATIIPNSLQPKLYHNPTVGAPDRPCVYLPIINIAGVPPPAGFTHAIVQTVNVADTNIYFPLDGRQPTTAEAVRYSCANVDNTPASPITNWYM